MDGKRLAIAGADAVIRDVGLVKGTPRATDCRTRPAVREWGKLLVGLSRLNGRYSHQKSATREANTAFVQSKVRTLAYDSSPIFTLEVPKCDSSSAWETCGYVSTHQKREGRRKYDL